MKSSSNLNISCKVVFSLNKWNKKVGSPSSFRRKRPFISLNSSASIENLSSSERARARARSNHAKNDAQKGCAMQLNGITLSQRYTWRFYTFVTAIGERRAVCPLLRQLFLPAILIAATIRYGRLNVPAILRKSPVIALCARSFK